MLKTFTCAHAHAQGAGAGPKRPSRTWSQVQKLSRPGRPGPIEVLLLFSVRPCLILQPRLSRGFVFTTCPMRPASCCRYLLLPLLLPPFLLLVSTPLCILAHDVALVMCASSLPSPLSLSCCFVCADLVFALLRNLASRLVHAGCP